MTDDEDVYVIPEHVFDAAAEHLIEEVDADADPQSHAGCFDGALVFESFLHDHDDTYLKDKTTADTAGQDST